MLDPETLCHRFYAREGEFLVEHSVDADWIESRAIPGFRVRRDWLNPTALPSVSTCVQEINA
ncbi:MAG: hypothetical protein KDK99_22330 [Verrucomicrobiales bacterium]|nr:hypothetical protein [Verrucomicrobiales bacterium]